MSERTAVYRLYGADGVLLYIGITQRLGRRWSRHAQTKDWWPLVTRQTADWHESWDIAACAEREAVKSERPLHNIVYAPPATPRLPPLSLDDPDAGRRIRELARADPTLGAVAQSGLRYHRAQKAVPQHIDAVLAALRDGCAPGDVASWSPFTPTYLRKLAREAGIPPALPGRKPKTDS